ncbi:MAG: hypothetical protein JW929_08455 [Anaerolineales bacterium]|nr:hypothetical protein [Anaerolineales bacterium]
MVASPGSRFRGSAPIRGPAAGLFLLSAATLLFEINLPRLFSVAQFYHFAFMIVSIALLGCGASGTARKVFPAAGKRAPARTLGRLVLAAGAGMLGSFLLINGLPFDSFSIAWDSRQVAVLVLDYLALTEPFFFSGLAVGMLLAMFPHSAGAVYAVNLAGSAAGCLAALAAPTLLGGEGVVVLSAGVSALAAFATAPPGWIPGKTAARPPQETRRSRGSADRRILLSGAAFLLLIFASADTAARLAGMGGFAFLEIRLSPYKGLSYVMQQPGAEILSREWNAFSRIDVVRSPAIHSVPGLSYRWLGPLPRQDGLLTDGDDLSPIVDPSADPAFAAFLPAAPAHRIRPQAEVLILDPRGGLDVLTALHFQAVSVTAVEENSLAVRAAERIYGDPHVETVVGSGRSYLRRTLRRFDLIMFSLTASYHPLRSGAYSLAEDYRFTVESFADALRRLKCGGMLVVTRWLQYPPSEELRAFALAVAAMEELGREPRPRIAAWRGYNTATILVKDSPFIPEELTALRESTGALAFDLIYLPDIREEEMNRFNILTESVYFRAFHDLLDADPRADFYAAYPYDVSPPTDDHPFFGHFFKGSQAGAVLAEFGKVWQPFGGAGYIVVLGLLILAVLLAAALLAVPPILRRTTGADGAESASATAREIFYFGMIGFGFLLVEIPLIQRFILFLDRPAYAMTAVLFSLLAFSGAGIAVGARLPLGRALLALAGILLSAPVLLPMLFSAALGLPLAARFALTVLSLAPAGFLMGVAFPGGIRWALARDPRPERIPRIWTVNGSASVVATVAAALLTLSLGFMRVFLLGALCYAGAGLAAGSTSAALRLPRPRR